MCSGGTKLEHLPLTGHRHSGFSSLASAGKFQISNFDSEETYFPVKHFHSVLMGSTYRFLKNYALVYRIYPGKWVLIFSPNEFTKFIAHLREDE
jgi:hypothetical protein